MKKAVFVGHRLEGRQWVPCSGGTETLEGAIDLLKHHFIQTHPHFQQRGSLDYRIYMAPSIPFEPTIVEFGLDAERPMTMNAVYKIIKGYVNAA